MPRSDVEIRLFGEVRLFRDGQVVARNRTDDEWRLLALLCLQGGAVIQRAELANRLWGYMQDEAQRRERLRQILLCLRKTLDGEAGRLEGDKETLRFDVRDLRIDVVTFDRALAARSPILARGMPVRRLCAGLEASGLSKEAVCWLWWERTRRMMQLAALERSQDGVRAAWEVYCRKVAGCEPEPLRASGVPNPTDETWLQGLLQLAADPDWTGAGAYLPAPSQAEGFGLLPSRLVGRNRDIAAVVSALQTHRLVTVCGPGGVGKSRLAVSVAEQCYPNFEGQVHWISLVELRDLAAIYHSLAVRLGVPTTGDVVSEIRRALARRDTLLVLDNLEHLGDVGVEIIYALLSAGSTRLLVTSRCPVGHRSEHTYLLEPLEVPAPAAGPGDLKELAENPSIRLFMERGRSVRADLELTPYNAVDIAEICRRLEGLPLAIELAAARCRGLAPGQILEQLARRFEILADDDPGLAQRHRALWTTIDWSCRMLEPEELGFFAQLAVFRGGWTLEGAAAVCSSAEADTHLGRLQELGLIRKEPDEHSGVFAETRYDMLETVREFALECLSGPEAAEARRRHLNWFCSLAGRSERELLGPDQLDWLSRMDRDQENFRAALDWASRAWKDRVTEALAAAIAEQQAWLACGLELYWVIRGHFHEAHERIRTALAQLPPDPSEARFHLLLAAANLAYQVGERDATELCDAALKLAKEWDELRFLAEANCRRGHLGRTPEESRWYLEPARDAFIQLGDRAGLANALQALGVMAIREERFADAGGILSECYDLYASQGNQRGVAKVLKSQGDLEHMRGDYAGAQDLYRRSVAALRRLRDPRRTCDVLENMAIAAARLGHPEYSAQLFGAGEALREPTGAPVPRHRLHYLQAAALVCERLGEHLFVDNWNEGYWMSADQIYDLALNGPHENTD